VRKVEKEMTWVGQYKSVDDSEFERLVTLRDAYKVMERFVVDYYSRGETPIMDFLTYLHLGMTVRSADPAAVDDFLNAAGKVLD
jgi:hypothetical protein